MEAAVACLCLKASLDLVNFSAPGDGVYAVITYPRSERFDLPALGCLYSVRMHRPVSVRCPKGSVSIDLHCDLQVPLLLVVISNHWHDQELLIV